MMIINARLVLDSVHSQSLEPALGALQEGLPLFPKDYSHFPSAGLGIKPALCQGLLWLGHP